MKRYIKVDNDNNIIAVFTWFQRWQFDGTEIELDDEGFSTQINGIEALTEWGFSKFIYAGGEAVEKTQTEIDSDVEFIEFYKQLKKDELQAYIGLHTLDILINHTWSEIVTQWQAFKTNASSWTTKQDIDNAFDIAINWLTS